MLSSFSFSLNVPVVVVILTTIASLIWFVKAGPKIYNAPHPVVDWLVWCMANFAVYTVISWVIVNSPIAREQGFRSAFEDFHSITAMLLVFINVFLGLLIYRGSR